MMSHREKQIRKSVDVLFTGMDDDALKQVMLACTLGYSEEEKERVCEELRKVNEENLRFITERFEIVANQVVELEPEPEVPEEKESPLNIE